MHQRALKVGHSTQLAGFARPGRIVCNHIQRCGARFSNIVSESDSSRVNQIRTSNATLKSVTKTPNKAPKVDGAWDNCMHVLPSHKHVVGPSPASSLFALLF